MGNHRSRVGMSHSGVYYSKGRVLNISNDVGHLNENGEEILIFSDANGNIGIGNEGYNNHGFNNIGNGNLGSNNVGNHNLGDWNIGDFNVGNHNRGSRKVSNNGGYHPAA